MISTLELRRIFMEWRTRFQRVQAILQPQEWTEMDWKKFGRALVGLLQSHGATWTVEPKTYWDLRWNLHEGGELICQVESIPGQKISLVVAQNGGFVQEVESYTWFWAEFNPEGEFIRDPYWVVGTWRDALATLLLPYQYQAGYYLAGSAPTPPSLMLGNSASASEPAEQPIETSAEQSFEEEPVQEAETRFTLKQAMPLKFESHAKVNLFLQVFEKRADGFHAIRTLMLPISLADTLTFELLKKPRIEIECSDPTLPTDKSNLVRHAAELLQSRYAPTKGARIHIQKCIPIGAGLGGGSSNGSTTLVGLNHLWNLNLLEDTLETLGAEFGSDTAFFIRNHPAFCEGRGEMLTPFSFPTALPLFLLNFGFGSSTAWAYQNVQLEIRNEELSSAQQILDALSESAKTDSPFSILHSPFIFQNDLEEPVFRKFPILRIAKDFLSAQPQVVGTMMCGSGSTIMAILRSAEESEPLREEVLKQFGNSVWIWNGSTLPSAERS